MSHFNNPNVHQYVPLWSNILVPEFLDLPGLELWQMQGILFLGQLMDYGGLKTFQSLKEGFVLPSSMFFRYLQLRHLFVTQSCSNGPAM